MLRQEFSHNLNRDLKIDSKYSPCTNSISTITETENPKSWIQAFKRINSETLGYAQTGWKSESTPAHTVHLEIQNDFETCSTGGRGAPWRKRDGGLVVPLVKTRDRVFLSSARTPVRRWFAASERKCSTPSFNEPFERSAATDCDI